MAVHCGAGSLYAVAYNVAPTPPTATTGAASNTVDCQWLTVLQASHLVRLSPVQQPDCKP